jgi:TPP-dependent pyruvate/acetoin dehydrogenase alpha subunit
MDTARLRDIYRTALLSRRFEERVIELSMAGELPATLHPGAGQEVEQAAAIAALGPEDKVLYGHRGATYWIARGMPLSAILCDIAGREGGTNNGKGGVMHVIDMERGVLGESGTLGGSFVISVGVGMALKRAGKGQVVVYFFGDGTSNRGTFHESLNWAAVNRLPCIYFCENNGWAVSMPASRSTAVRDVADRAAGYGVPGVVVDGNDAPAVYEAMSAAVQRARNGDGPSLIEAKVTRLMGHYIGDLQPYRADAAETGPLDPLPRLQQQLVEAKALDEKAIAKLEAEIKAEIDAAVEVVRAAKPLQPEAALQDLYA